MSWMDAPANVREWFEDWSGTHQAADAGTVAVFKLLELHAPEAWNDKVYCQHCLDTYGGQQEYPCRTIQMIAEGIGTQALSFRIAANRGESA